MQTATRQRRPAKPPTTGTRLVGHRDVHGDRPIYHGSTSAFGELGNACWFRMRPSAPFGGEPDCYRVAVEACGTTAHLDAVVDDFGDLVAVGYQTVCPALRAGDYL